LEIAYLIKMSIDGVLPSGITISNLIVSNSTGFSVILAVTELEQIYAHSPSRLFGISGFFA